MFTAAPRLTIRRPSPTAAEFTVTTLPPQTLTIRLLRILLLLFRLAFALLTLLLLLHALWPAIALAASSSRSRRSLFPSPDLLWHAFAAYHRSAPAAVLANIAASVPLQILAPGALAALYVLSLRAHKRESLLVLRGLGVQTSESAGTYLSSAATRFIPTEKIRDILVNEAFRGFEVRYYLVVVVEGEDDVVVVFPGLLPRRQIVETVWRGARECLYEGREEKGVAG